MIRALYIESDWRSRQRAAGLKRSAKESMRHIQFCIGRIEDIGNSEALVGGRCCGDEIRKGDRTEVMIKTDGVNEIMRRDLMIIFHTIRVYDREVDLISPGMIAGIIIPDTLAEQMHLNWILAGDCIDQLSVTLNYENQDAEQVGAGQPRERLLLLRSLRSGDRTAAADGRGCLSFDVLLKK